MRQKEKERIPLNDGGVNEARKFAREDRMKRKIRENMMNGRKHTQRAKWPVQKAKRVETKG